MPRLIVIKGADEGKQFDLTGDLVTVGRDASSQIRLHDTEISRRHAEFRKADGGYRVLDIGSANGTFVNTQPVRDVLLRTGDHVQIGQTVAVYSDNHASEDHTHLAEQISLIARADVDFPSAIIKTIGEAEGSRILAQPQLVEGNWLRARLANLSVMYETIQAVSHILDVQQLLDRIMELIFQSIDADRGCIMLRNVDSGELEPRAVRWRQAGRKDKIAVSRTVVDHVLQDKTGVLVSDARQDERFNAGLSIVRFGIREVICVPMKGRHETLGVLYLDTQSTPRELVEAQSPTGKFSEEHLALAIAIAHQAALAVEETRYHHALVHAERLAAVGQTIAAVSHHIKNILQGLRSGTDILRMGMIDKDDTLLQQGWKIVEKNQGKIYDLVMDMLSYSKEREPAIEIADVNEIVKDVVELLAGRAQEKGIHLETSFDSLPAAQVDPEGIHRAVLNIVGNAFDAVEECDNPQVAVGTKLDSDGEWLLIVVLDNGNGIPPEKLNDIFRPFVSTKGAKGTGLGLAVSRKILREHGGDILVQSQPGKTKFTLRLPIRSTLAVEAFSGGTRQVPIVRPPQE